MKIRLVNAYCLVVIFLAIGFLSSSGIAADKLVGIHSARTMSQSMPWIADEVGLFKKYDLEFQLVFISSAAMVTAAMLSGDGEVAITGGESITRAFTQGVTELIFIASAKNTLTHSILGKPEIKSPEDLKGKKLGLTRLGSNSHYFVIQALRKYGMERDRSEFHPDRRPGRESCGITERRRGCRHDDRTVRRRSGDGSGLPLCRVWAGPAYSFWRGNLGGAPLLDPHARAGHRKVCARHGGSGENHVHG